MGDAESAVWYAMTLAVGNEARWPGGESWNPPLEMNRRLPQVTPAGHRAALSGGRVVTPPVDVRIHDDEITLFAEMPGIPPGNIGIRVMPRFIEIIGMPAGGDDGTDPAVAEALTARIDSPAPQKLPAAPGTAGARLRDGVLEVRLPRRALMSAIRPFRLPVSRD